MSQLQDLKLKCEELGIVEGVNVYPTKIRVDKENETYEPWQKENKVYSKPVPLGRHLEFSIDDYTKAIQRYFIEYYRNEGTLSPFIETILNMKSPMLALQIKHLKPEVQEEVKKDFSNYVYEQKIDGTRCMLCYDKDFGWDFYSRNKSVTDCLPISYKTRLLLPKIDTSILEKYHIDKFIIDSELVPQDTEIHDMADGTEVVADTQLSLVTSILGSLDDLSHKIQETNPLKFMTFDIIKLNDLWLYDYPLKKRKEVLDKVFTALKLAKMGNYIEKVPSTMYNKDEFYNKIVAAGDEGVVAKDLNSKYDTLGKRKGEWVKIKRSVSQAMALNTDESESILSDRLGDTLDAFVIGFDKGNDGTNIENLVGTLHFGIYLLDDNDNVICDEEGNPKIHHIGSISGLSLKLREMITEIDSEGKVQLRKDFYNKVAEIDGQDISSKNLRLSHCRLISWRPDRSADTCKIKESFIKGLVL